MHYHFDADMRSVYARLTGKHRSAAIEEFIRGKIIAASNAFHDAHGVVRPGREPDYLNGRWCPKCHNSLPEGWVQPCDVCGTATTTAIFEGLVAETGSA